MSGRLYKIKAIVEGEGERRTVPALIQRWLSHEMHYDFRADDEAMCSHGVGKLIAPRAESSKRVINRQRGIEYFVEKAVQQGADGILIVLDADKECARRRQGGIEALGPEILRRACATAAHVPIGVVVADPEFEAWFLMPPCLEAMRRAGLIAAQRWPDDLTGLARKRNCKDVVKQLLGGEYSPSVQQHPLSRHLEFTEPFRDASRSYGKLLRELARLTSDVRRRKT